MSDVSLLVFHCKEKYAMARSMQDKQSMIDQLLLSSLQKEVMLFFGSVGFVCMSVCLFVDNITQKSYEWIGVNLWGVLNITMKNWLNF